MSTGADDAKEVRTASRSNGASLTDRLDLTPETLPPEKAAKVTDSPDLMPTGEKTEDGKALFATRAKVEARGRV